MVQFLPLDVTDEDSVGAVLSHIDNAIQCVLREPSFSSLYCADRSDTIQIWRARRTERAKRSRRRRFRRWGMNDELLNENCNVMLPNTNYISQATAHLAPLLPTRLRLLLPPFVDSSISQSFSSFAYPPTIPSIHSPSHSSFVY